MPVWGMLTTTGTSLVLASRIWNEVIFIGYSDGVQPSHSLVEGMRALLLSMADARTHAARASHIYVADVGAAAADDERIHQGIHVMAAQSRGFVLHYHQVGEMPHLEGAADVPERLRAAATGELPERHTETGRSSEASAAFLAQTLSIFQEPQLLDSVDATVAVGTNGDASTCGHELVGGEQAVPQISLGDGADYHAGTGLPRDLHLSIRGVGRVHQVPAGPERDMSCQHCHWSSSVGSLTFLDFAALLADVDMHRRVGAHDPGRRRQQLVQGLRRHRTQRMRRQPKVDAMQLGEQRAELFDAAMHEAALLVAGRPAEAALLI